MIWILQEMIKIWCVALKTQYPGSKNNNKRLETLKHFNPKSKKNNI